MSTSMDDLRSMYDHVWCTDFEFSSGDSGSEAPTPICMVTTDALSGGQIRVWFGDAPLPECPITLDSRSLYVSYYAAAETNCHVALGWPTPRAVLDLHAEFRQIFNGRDVQLTAIEKEMLKKNERASLRICLFAFGLQELARATVNKPEMQQLCAQGGPYSDEQKQAILDYCASDTTALVKLLPRMLPLIDLRPAVIRGRYISNLGAVERHGVPLDLPLVRRLTAHWNLIIDRIIELNREEFNVIGHRDIDRRKFEVWMAQHGYWDWPQTKTGRLRSDRNILSELAKYDPRIMRLKEFLCVVRSMKLFEDLRVGKDGRNRVGFSPFASTTGRNQPSNAKFIFGPATFVRGLIQPNEGCALIHADFSGQEYAEAAIFSGDEAMIDDYFADDPYLGFAKRIGMVPANATRESHAEDRNRFKIACGLGVIYGAGYKTVAFAGEMSEEMAFRVLREHRFTYPQFWQWRDRTIDRGMLEGILETPLGWKWPVPWDAGSPSISNFLMQGSGADMMRIAVCLAVESGLHVCAPIHDALLVQCRIDGLSRAQSQVRECMREASRIVLGGREIKIGIDPPVVHPDHYADKRGEEIWKQVMDVLSELEGWPVGAIG
jgi:DNA polymerase I